MKNILLSLVNFNLPLKGFSYLMRNLIYTVFPLILILSLGLNQLEPTKWIIVIPFMYLMAINDYNRLYTLFPTPLPIFIIMLLVSLPAVISPGKFIILTNIIILWRLIMAFNIGNKKNNKILNMKNLKTPLKENEITVTSLKAFITINFTACIIAFSIFWSNPINYLIGDGLLDNLNHLTNWLMELIGTTIILFIALIVHLTKKKGLSYSAWKTWSVVFWIIFILSTLGKLYQR